MKRSPERFAGRFAGAVGATALLLATGCTTMEDMTDTTTAINRTNEGPGYYRVQSRYYHCHQNQRCHNVRHPNYYTRGDGDYRRDPPTSRINQPR
ncbi:hypothetical protein KUV95_09330 [Microbulbifer agarilyticus]|uniref:hypothetical protein n=1 Tax=Microbulbifer agarilyticus TaxID=260552 RepID=UPI001C94F41C|nr:hypothetical protein [Microbulbifer agarilyticus]MBY6211759.1 hypothetical protein [Microbulbifer agarilyticus]